MSTETGVTIIAICQLVYAVAALLLVGGIIYAVFAIKRMASKKVD